MKILKIKLKRHINKSDILHKENIDWSVVIQIV